MAESAAKASSRARSYSRSDGTARAAAAAGLFSSCAKPAANWPTASSFSRSRSTPLTVPLTDSNAGRNWRISVSWVNASRRSSSPSTSNRTVSTTAKVLPRYGVSVSSAMAPRKPPGPWLNISICSPPTSRVVSSLPSSTMWKAVAGSPW